jgi:hypothetical protein
MKLCFYAFHTHAWCAQKFQVCVLENKQFNSVRLSQAFYHISRLMWLENTIKDLNQEISQFDCRQNLILTEKVLQFVAVSAIYLICWVLKRFCFKFSGYTALGESGR